MGTFGKQPQGSLLLAHAHRARPTGRREEKLVSPHFGHELDARIRRIGAAMLRRLACLRDYFFRRRRLEDELDEELRSSFEIVVDRLVARRLSSDAARRAAR